MQSAEKKVMIREYQMKGRFLDTRLLEEVGYLNLENPKSKIE
jgi:hypothetical protein